MGAKRVELSQVWEQLKFELERHLVNGSFAITEEQRTAITDRFSPIHGKRFTRLSKGEQITRYRELIVAQNRWREEGIDLYSILFDKVTSEEE